MVKEIKNENELGSIKQIQDLEQKSEELINRSNARKSKELNNAKNIADELISNAIKAADELRLKKISEKKKDLEAKKQNELKSVNKSMLKLKQAKLNQNQLNKISVQIIKQIIK
ncbi:MAG: hypothetical protein M1168_03665 [Candidatus Marsarchaeota archaeon]|nr:hypothetical protein [Candidatus Marsarchaeota archaeon]MCL5095048.1 hypothetical protein [Candidatus Marsarchaeota archaeon]